MLEKLPFLYLGAFWMPNPSFWFKENKEKTDENKETNNMNNKNKHNKWI